MDPSYPTDDHRLLAAADQRPSGIAIIRFDGLRHLCNGELVLLERERVDCDVVLLDEPAEGDDIGDTFHLREPRCDDPILDLAQFHLGESFSFKDVAIELADAG